MRLWLKDGRTGREKLLFDLAKTLKECGTEDGARMRVETSRGDRRQLNRGLHGTSPGLPDVMAHLYPEQVNDDTLNCAFRYSDRDVVSFVIGMGARANEMSLNAALRLGDPVFVQQAIELGATGNGGTLCCALMNGNPLLVDLVLNLGTFINEDTLDCAILHGDIRYVRKVMELGGAFSLHSIACAHHVRGSDELFRCVHEAAELHYAAASQISAYFSGYLEFLSSTYGRLKRIDI